MVVGGNGTKFTKEQSNMTYARIDKDETPGYFTYKAESDPKKSAKPFIRIIEIPEKIGYSLSKMCLPAAGKVEIGLKVLKESL